MHSSLAISHQGISNSIFAHSEAFQVKSNLRTLLETFFVLIMEKAVFFCIDTMIATSEIYDVSKELVAINIKHETQRYSSSVLIKEDNVAQSLKIKTYIKNPMKTAIIDVSYKNH